MAQKRDPQDQTLEFVFEPSLSMKLTISSKFEYYTLQIFVLPPSFAPPNHGIARQIWREPTKSTETPCSLRTFRLAMGVS